MCRASRQLLFDSQHEEEPFCQHLSLLESFHEPSSPPTPAKHSVNLENSASVHSRLHTLLSNYSGGKGSRLDERGSGYRERDRSPSRVDRGSGYQERDRSPSRGDRGSGYQERDRSPSRGKRGSGYQVRDRSPSRVSGHRKCERSPSPQQCHSNSKITFRPPCSSRPRHRSG